MKTFCIVGSIAYAFLIIFIGKFLGFSGEPSEVASSESLHRRAVAEGGGQWVGEMEGLVYYNSPQTGSTLVSKTSEISADGVRRHIEESNAKFNIRRSS